MNNTKLVITVVVMIFIIFICFFFSAKNVKNDTPEEELELKTYDSNVVCKFESSEISEDESSYYSNVYINYGDGGNISDIIYQTVTQTEFSDSYMQLVNDLYNLYNNVNGIKTDIYKSAGYVVTTIEYDFTVLDLKTAKKELGDMLEEDSFILTGKLPIAYNVYIDKYLNEYSCEVK